MSRNDQCYSCAALRSSGRAVLAELAAVVAAQDELLDWEIAGTLAARLHQARRVLTFGAGRSRTVALGFAQRLTHIGLAAATVGESANSRCGPDDVVIVVSGSGATPSALVIAEQARAAGTGTVGAITATPDSPLARLSDLVCVVTARAKGSTAPATAPYTAQFDLAALAVTEAVAAMVMNLRGMSHQEIESWRPNVE